MVTTLSEVRSDLVDRLAALIKASRISRQQRVRRQTEGEFLDMDASIAAMIAKRAGEAPDTRVYGRYERRSRDMSVLVLIDASRSTTDRARGSYVGDPFAGVAEISTPNGGFVYICSCNDQEHELKRMRARTGAKPVCDARRENEQTREAA